METVLSFSAIAVAIIVGLCALGTAVGFAVLGGKVSLSLINTNSNRGVAVVNINATLLGQAISFAMFVWFCMKYVWPPIMQAIEERQKKIADGLQAAEQRNRARDELRKQVATLAVAGAEKILERSIDKDAQKDILDNITAKL